jgi:uncharacterized alpha-E superfamily protein
MARYIERAENTARLVLAYNHLIMDIPRGSQPGWEILVRILNANDTFNEWFRVPNEQNILRLLIGEADAVCSIPFAIANARENVRTTRDVLPDEVWELVNELHLYTAEAAEKSVGRRNRQQYLEEIIKRSQVIHGVLRGTLCRDHSYCFIKLGQLLERADMTTRIIDVGASDILEREGAGHGIEHLLWGTLLKSMSALGAYRRMIGPLVEKDAAVDFVFLEQTFPRSLRFCLQGIGEELGRLNNNNAALAVLDRTRRKLRNFSAESMDPEDLHRFIDELQLNINAQHQAIDSTWFISGRG